MVSKTLKALVAVGLAAAAGQSFALYSIGGPYIYSHYCAGFMKGDHGRAYSSPTYAGCQSLLNAGMAAEPGPYTEFTPCHVCAQKFSYMMVAPSDPDVAVSTETATQYMNLTDELRRRFRIEEYERAQSELERSFSPPPAAAQPNR
ncbi:hypothetical protein [Tahibacter soli]|uniref:Uncharacterized protein n=1 Tax=Tahibacter soli TaxID=2983605 RepID=A0A9X4BKY9_9GAMM|nr:hypothetical protein [Tahibacter soli]MDC8014757.1 hypothetical protein [Tahibacter soli]